MLVGFKFSPLKIQVSGYLRPMEDSVFPFHISDFHSVKRGWSKHVMLMWMGHKTQKRHLALITENNHFTHGSKQKHINMWVTILLKPNRQKLPLLQYITHSNYQCTTAQPTFFMKTFSLVEYHQFIVFFTFH